MKPQILTVFLLGALAIAADAQTITPPASPTGSAASPSSATPDASTAPTAAAPASTGAETTLEAPRASTQVKPDTGFFYLLQAAEALGDNPKTLPVLRAGMTPAKRLDYDREFASQLAEPLRLLRVALLQPITPEPVGGQTLDLSGMSGHNYNANFRQLARGLDSQARVRLADGDAAGALDARLDCLELGTIVSRGPLISMLTGSAIESIGRTGIDEISPKLSAEQCRLAAARMAQIAERRPSFEQILRLESERNLRYSLLAVPDEATRADYQTAAGRKTRGVSARQARESLALTPDQVRADNARLFLPAISAARISPRLAAMVPLPNDLNSVTAGARKLLQKPDARFIYERGVAQDRLLAGAFTLRAHKLESSNYPATFEAPRDPFSPDHPLIYRLEGDNYLLYSIGPDARDNHGQAIRPQAIYFDTDSGQTRVAKARGFNASSKGDIVAPVF